MSDSAICLHADLSPERGLRVPLELHRRLADQSLTGSSMLELHDERKVSELRSLINSPRLRNSAIFERAILSIQVFSTLCTARKVPSDLGCQAHAHAAVPSSPQSTRPSSAILWLQRTSPAHQLRRSASSRSRSTSISMQVHGT